MHKLIINKLGPIDHCELDCSDYLAFTGPQSSGKSTIAKAIFFFRTIKDDILNLAMKRALSILDLKDERPSFQRSVNSFIRDKFMRIFGSSWGMDNEMYITYYFTADSYITVCLKEETRFNTPNYVWVCLSDKVRKFLNKNDEKVKVDYIGLSSDDKLEMQKDLEELFDDKYSIVYIPAGRSMITLLSTQLNYIYSTMEDNQKRTIDYCTQNYLERILRLKEAFTMDWNTMASISMMIIDEPWKRRYDIIDEAIQLMKKILKGTYQYTNGEERINLDDNKYVKINFSSSGQQESVWILNVLFYYLTQEIPVLFIIEEPESHLFPEAQKYITEFISLVFNQGNSMVVTTHSPYVLGTINNLLYAPNSVNEHKESEAEVNDIIPKSLWLDREKLTSWFVKDGGIENCFDDDIGLIENERIDEISRVINDDFDRILDATLSKDEVE